MEFWTKKKKEYLDTILRQAEEIESLKGTVDKLAREVRAHRSQFGVKTPAYAVAEESYLAYKQELRRLKNIGTEVDYEQLMALVAAVRQKESRAKCASMGALRLPIENGQ